MHQPPGNLLDLLNNATKWHEAKQILLAYQRPLDYAERYPDMARFCVCFSGVLLEQLQDPELIDRCWDFTDIPKMLDRYAAASNIELAGTGYYHPLFPLIPADDWRNHIQRGRDKVVEVFGRTPVIFWPPELGFSCEMIPDLVDAGYRQVLCDGVHLRPERGLTPSEMFYHPFIAEQSGAQIVLIPRDAQLSLAQQGGTSPDWFCDEVLRKTSGLQGPALVTTWTDGENGNWFRNEHEPSNYWGHFFAPYLENMRAGTAILQPTSLADFLAQYPPDQKTSVRSGSWEYNPSKSEASSFERWAGSREQREVLDELHSISKEYEYAVERAGAKPSSAIADQLAKAHDQILRAEASDNLYYGSGWLWRARDALAQARQFLSAIS